MGRIMIFLQLKFGQNTNGKRLVNQIDFSEEFECDHFLLISFQITGSVDSTDFWVGLYDKVKEGTFVWGSGRDLSIKHWNMGQPNNYKGNENCARFYKGGLDDHSCKVDTAEVVCQKGWT